MSTADYWIDVGRPQNYVQAHCDILDRRFEAPLGREVAPSVWSADDRVQPMPAQIVGPVFLGAGVRTGGPLAQQLTFVDQPGEGRKLLMFSDSRQAAAFFAPYFETTYQTIQHRRLILDGLGRATRDGDPAHIGDLAYHVVKAAEAAHVFQRRMSLQERQRSADRSDRVQRRDGDSRRVPARQQHPPDQDRKQEDKRQ